MTQIAGLQKELRRSLTRYAVTQQEEERRILHGWGDQRSYFVGSFSDSDGVARDGLTSNAFWVLSDMLEADRSLQEDILAAMERLDSRYGLKTFQPGFEPSAVGVGRIVRIPIGTAENGAVYIHATTFAIAALFRMGQAQKAWEQIHKILPFAPHFKDPSHSPFVMPNAYLDNPSLNLTGQSMDDWQTGSSNVLLKLLVRYVFGFHPTLDHLHIAPASYFPWDAFQFEARAHQCPVRIEYCQEAGIEQREIRLNGQPWEALVLDETMRLLAAQIPYERLSTERLNVLSITDPIGTDSEKNP